jgi:hypothetical protein
MHEDMNEYMSAELMRLGSIKAIYLKDSDLKISTFTKRWVVKCQTAICLTKPNVLIHPDGLSFSETENIKTALIVRNLNTWQWLTIYIINYPNHVSANYNSHPKGEC